MVTPLIKIIPDFSTTLALKVAVAATTASLSTATDTNGDVLATGKYGFTIDRKNGAKEYFTATLTGTSLTNVATIDITDGTETAGFLKEHRKGAEVIISDFVAIKRIQDVLETGYVDTYTPTTDYQVATKKYADGLTIGAAPNADQTTKGIVEIATIAEINSGATVGSTGASLVVTPDALKGSTYETRLDALEVTPLSPIRRVYTSSGTWTKPAGLKYIEVELVGGSAGVMRPGSGSATDPSGSGGYCKKVYGVSSLSSTEAYVIGAAGTDTGSTSTLGTNGGNTTFKSMIGYGSAAGSSLGGNATGGDINIPGGDGDTSMNTSYTNLAGTGGSNPLGIGGATTSGISVVGKGYGAGSSGAVYSSSGAVGLAGVIILTEYY